MKQILAIMIFFSGAAFGDDKSADKVPSAIVHLGQGDYFPNVALLVDKSSRQLEVWRRDGQKLQLIKSYPIDYGKNLGNKSANNDAKTPEGIYKFEKLLEGPALSFQEYGIRAFTMNYPNLFDQREHKTGSGIWLHAVPNEKGLQRGSKGCVVVSNESIKDVSNFIALNRTPIIVESKADYISTLESENQKKYITAWMKQWLRSWQSKTIDDYITYYDESFSSRNTKGLMNKVQWKAYKNNLNRLYENIQISVSDPFVVHHENNWEISFLQKYSSTNFEDFGRKTLYLKGNIDQLKIIAEDFENTSDQKALAEFANYNFSCCTDSVGSAN